MSKRKLTSQQADDIRYFHAKWGYSQRELAEMYQVGRTTIRHVLDGTTYPVKIHRPTTGPSPLKDTSIDKLLEGSEFSVYELEGKNWDHADKHWSDFEMEDNGGATIIAALVAAAAGVGVVAIIAHAFGVF